MEEEENQYDDLSPPLESVLRHRVSGASRAKLEEVVYGLIPKQDETMHLETLNKIREVFQICSKCTSRHNSICKHTFRDAFRMAYRIRNRYLEARSYEYFIADIPNSNLSNKYPLPSKLGDIFVSIDVQGDGNCGYRAISMCLTMTEYYAKYLRRAMYLCTRYHEDVLNRLSQLEENEQYKITIPILKDNKWLKPWGLIVASEFLSRRIVVYQKSNMKGREVNGTTYSPTDDRFPKYPIYLFCDLEASHFIPLFKRNIGVQAPPADFVPPEYHKVMKKDSLLQYMYHLRQQNNIPMSTEMPIEIDLTEDDLPAKKPRLISASYCSTCPPVAFKDTSKDVDITSTKVVPKEIDAILEDENMKTDTEDVTNVIRQTDIVVYRQNEKLNISGLDVHEDTIVLQALTFNEYKTISIVTNYR